MRRRPEEDWWLQELQRRQEPMDEMVQHAKCQAYAMAIPPAAFIIGLILWHVSAVWSTPPLLTFLIAIAGGI